jgi:hypothetical protein
MQVHLPIAVCLLKDVGSNPPTLILAVHQVLPENPRSITEFVDRQGRDKVLIHHVIFFTYLSYAECQSSVRTHIAKRSGARIVGRTKVIVGNVERIRHEMTEISLNRLQFTSEQTSHHFQNDIESENISDDDSSSMGSLNSFINDDDEDEEDEDSTEEFNKEKEDLDDIFDDSIVVARAGRNKVILDDD